MDEFISQEVNTSNIDKQSTNSTRGKNDPARKYVTFIEENRSKVYTCLYCLNKYRGGGINRMKQHLAGKLGQIASCKSVPHDIKCQMTAHLEDVKKNKDDSKINYSEDYDEAIEEVRDISSHPSTITGKRKTMCGPVDKYFASRTTSGAQPGLKSVFASKEAVKNAKLAIARWLYATCIPFNAVQSPYFQLALDAVAGIGPGFKAPSYDEVRVNLLGDCKKECQLLIENYRSNWKDSGCTLMADGWTDQMQRTLINFLVYCPAGMIFVKSVDASDMVKDANTLLNLFVDVIEWVGPANIVHVVTDNATNYVAAGRLIHEKYENIFWSPCAAHCLNLILKDISSLPQISNLASRASKITVFVYNHMIFLSWLRKRTGWKEIVRPGATRFATIFITLKSVCDHKEDLQALVVDKHFTGHRLARSVNGKVVSEIALDNKFWQDCLTVVKLVGPLIRLLRLVDADEKPSLGYVYEGMQRAKNGIKEMFKRRKLLYKPYIDIIKARWDKHLHRSIHAAAYFLNPAFFYDECFIEKHRVLQGLLDLLEIKSICSDSIKAMKEIRVYRERLESFSRPSCLAAAKSLTPDEWWRLFGGSAPVLKTIAIRILSQTSSSSGCERNWSLFDIIHTKRRNRLEHQRLCDHVYVTYNLRLKTRKHQKKRSYDPIDYECIDKLDFWVTEEDPQPEFAGEEIENLIYNDNAIPIIYRDDVDMDLNMAETSSFISTENGNDGMGDMFALEDVGLGAQMNANYDY